MSQVMGLPPLRPGAHYSQVVTVTGAETFLFLTGLTSRDADTREILFKGDIEGQARQVFKLLDTVLGNAGATRNDVVQIRVYYKDVSYVPLVVSIRDDFFANEPYPAITGIVCDLTSPEFLIEIDAIAVLRQ